VIRSSQAKRTWDGLIVAPEHWEPRHPQDFVRVRAENASAKGLVNTEPDDIYVSKTCSTREAVAGIAITGCALVGYNDYDIPSGTFSGSPL